MWAALFCLLLAGAGIGKAVAIIAGAVVVGILLGALIVVLWFVKQWRL